MLGSPACSTTRRLLFTYKNQWNSPTGYGRAAINCREHLS